MAENGSSDGSAADPSDDVPRWPAANPTPAPSEPSGDSEAQPDATDAPIEAGGEQEQHDSGGYGGSGGSDSSDVEHTARHAAPDRSEPAQPETDEPELATAVLPQQPEASDADESAEPAPDAGPADDADDADDAAPVEWPAAQAEAPAEPPEAQTEPVPGPITPSEPGTPADPDPSQPTAPDPGDPELPGPGPDQPAPTSPPAEPAPSDPGTPGPTPEGPLPSAGTGSASSSDDEPRRPAAQRGSLTIDDKVVSKIAAIAVQGISDISTTSSGLARLTGIGDNATKATVAGTQVRAQIHVTVPWPQSVGQAAARVRTTVAGEIGRLTGLNVDGVDVHAEMGEPVSDPEPRRVH